MPVKGENSDWLKSLEGKSPLLSRAELEYIAKVKRLIIQEAKSRPKPNFVNDWSLKDKLPVMKENFKKVVEALEGNIDAKEYFLNTYPEWRTVRDLTVKQLKEIAKTVNQNRQESTAVQGVSSVVSFVGGLICLATGGVALRLLGSAFMGLGTLASVGISTNEIGLLEKLLKRAEKIIEEDRKYSEKLWNWISDVSLIQGALDTIRNIDVDENVKKTAIDFYSIFKKSTENDLTSSITKILSCLNISPATCNEFADVIEILIKTYILCERFRPFFTLVFEAYKGKKILSVTFDTILCSVKMPSIFGNRKLTLLQKSSIITGIALDAINIIKASNDANESCKEALKIIEAVEKLEEEARGFQKLHDAVISL